MYGDVNLYVRQRLNVHTRDGTASLGEIVTCVGCSDTFRRCTPKTYNMARRYAFQALAMDIIRKHDHDCGADRPIELEQCRAGPGIRWQGAVIIPSAKYCGRWQLQVFDARSLLHDHQHDSRVAAVAAAVKRGFRVYAPGILERAVRHWSTRIRHAHYPCKRYRDAWRAKRVVTRLGPRCRSSGISSTVTTASRNNAETL